MGKLGFYFDMQKCIGCRACQIACKDRNDLPIGSLYRRVLTYETGKFPNATWYHNTATCNHCSSPLCVENCPTGAMCVGEDTTVLHDDGKCIGCETCVHSCPYGVPVYLEEKGVVGKCDACNALRNASLNPVCVDACTMRALDFGDVEELEAKYGAGLVRDLPCLPDSSATSPATLIKATESAANASFVEQRI